MHSGFTRQRDDSTSHDLCTRLRFVVDVDVFWIKVARTTPVAILKVKNPAIIFFLNCVFIKHPSVLIKIQLVLEFNVYSLRSIMTLEWQFWNQTTTERYGKVPTELVGLPCRLWFWMMLCLSKLFENPLNLKKTFDEGSFICVSQYWICSWPSIYLKVCKHSDGQVPC